MTVIDEIIVGVRADLAERQERVALAQLERAVAGARPAIDPLPALSAPGLAVIAEVKRASPSKGALAEIPDPARLAASYAGGGASAISVLTERRRFNGSLDDLDAVRAAVDVPVLRKDFMVTEYQVWEARAHGADLILLIVAALSDAELATLSSLATDLGMTCLVEVHTTDEVARALDGGFGLIGVNNRDLRTLRVDTARFALLADAIGPGPVKVAESGIFTGADAAAAYAAGADAILVGEALVRHEDPTRAVGTLIAAAGRNR